MMTIKYTYILFFLMLSYLPSFGQCTVPSLNPGKIEVLHADSQTTTAETQAKVLTGRVVFIINEFVLKADSAIIYNNGDQLEAFGNVTLTKEGETYQSGKKATYHEELNIIRFDDTAIQNIGNNSDALKPTEADYIVSQ